ncbi:sensor histidine kinase [Phycicoccus endophyticus]|uniref:histidine kinase n=1 Tax=Phycicoccus endophyticus TaxID=1690220 RepID=A0A7G9R1A8_9MICO|nr:histidine kinase [Phycicoccus endophyticus]NHI18841.1 sensor histidine kinase [Phycicoccus endophyticus]QNN49383.1 sensor histidine kinase [Phycicoccus endophyticus]GGL36110.1 two-component sensor histidine kinase [Phycicoccus endophyticus]
MTRLPPAATRLAGWFGVGDPWERPRPAVGRADVLTAAVVELIGLVGLELVRSIGNETLQDLPFPWWLQWLAVSSGAALLVGRRRWPVAVAALAAGHMILVGVTMPVVMGQFTLQVVYFVALMSGVAWARDRRWMLVVVGFIVVVMFAWIALQFAVGSALQGLVDDYAGTPRHGVLAPVPAAVLLTVLVNVLYFGGAVVIGGLQWRSARDRALLARQAATISAQTEALRTRAVAEERLRIARELHDVVAHHVSVIGIQAAAARRVMDRDPAATRRALEGIEGSSRAAVSSMRGLLGTLRSSDAPQDGTGPRPRSPQPGLEDLPVLVEACSTPGRRVGYDLVESSPGAAGRCSPPLAHSIHRTVQEALTNVEKHSTATRVSVVVRLEEGRFAELEVVDDGRPRAGSSGSGLGQLGIRERAALHRGSVEIGPRAGGGYRVRVRYPWPDDVAADAAPAAPTAVGGRR